MQLRFAPPNLQALDREHGGTLVVCAFDEERPLKGLAGRVDWRLCGRLSKLIDAGNIDAAFGATLLCPINGRLPFERLMFVGLGSVADYGKKRYSEACHIIAWKLARMGETDFAMSLPGHLGRGLGLRDAVWGWRHGVIGSFDSESLGELTVCMLAEREPARELRPPLMAVVQEVNDALRREFEQRTIANAPPMPSAPRPEPLQQAPIETPSPSRRGWQSGVMKIGPATAAAHNAKQSAADPAEAM